MRFHCPKYACPSHDTEFDLYHRVSLTWLCMLQINTSTGTQKYKILISVSPILHKTTIHRKIANGLLFITVILWPLPLYCLNILGGRSAIFCTLVYKDMFCWLFWLHWCGVLISVTLFELTVVNNWYIIMVSTKCISLQYLQKAIGIV